jgi:hypothetical protein
MVFYDSKIVMWRLEPNKFPYLRKGDSIEVGFSSGTTSLTLKNPIYI